MKSRSPFLEFSFNDRERLLMQFGDAIVANVARPEVAGKVPIRLQADEYGNAINAVPGPRVAVLEILAGVDAGRLLKVLSADDCALVRQLIPWDFDMPPSVYLRGRRVRVEAAWPKDLQRRSIRLDTLGQCPKDGKRFITGINEHGSTVRLAFTDSTPHVLVSGTTGSGKSYAMRSTVAQLSRNPRARFVLIDGKWGEGLGPLQGISGQVGPLATDFADVRGALFWACMEMKNRYLSKAQGSPQEYPPIVVAFDEFQEFTGSSNGDDATVEMLRRIAVQGRAANVHILAGTQHPSVDVFGDKATRRQFSGRIALKVLDYPSSEAAVGGPSPRADLHLLGHGDAYVIAPSAVQRVQMAYIPPADLRKYAGGQPALDAWPEYDAEELGWAEADKGRPKADFTEAHLALGLIAAQEGIGRPTLLDRMRALTGKGMGSGRAARLLKTTQAVHQELQAQGYTLTPVH